MMYFVIESTNTHNIILNQTNNYYEKTIIINFRIRCFRNNL